MWLGLIPTVSVFPGQTLPTGLVGLTLLIPVALWGRFRVTLPHLLFGLFVVYALVSGIWSVGNPWFGSWILMCFVIGRVVGSAFDGRKVWYGIVIGLSASSMMAVAQNLGLTLLHTHSSAPAGLYYNHVLHGWILALGIVGLVCQRMWVYSIPLLPGLYLSESRGAWALLAFGLIATIVRKPLVLFAGLLLSASLVMHMMSGHEVHRLEIWRYALGLLTPLGNGIGSFRELWYHDNTQLWNAEYVHNDYIQLIFEFGIGVVPLFAAGVWLALQTGHPLWPLYCTCCVLAIFGFPFYTPITAFIWALACGGIMRTNDGYQGSV